MAAVASPSMGVSLVGGMGAGSSVGGLLAQLEEEEEAVQVFAVRCLVKVVDAHWAEIAGSVAHVEALVEDESFPERTTASLLASKVFYHLGELEDALTYALGAGALFDPGAGSEYSRTILAEGIDSYIAARQSGDTSGIDARLEAIVDKMFLTCVAEGDYQQSVGFALESRRVDLLKESVRKAPSPSAALEHAVKICNTVIGRREERQLFLKLIVDLFAEVPDPDHVSICQCNMFLDEPGKVAEVLEALIRGDDREVLTAYQVAFDLSDNELQSFLYKVTECIETSVNLPPPPVAPTPALTTAANVGEAMEEKDKGIEGEGAGGGGGGEEDKPEAMETDEKEPLLTKDGEQQQQQQTTTPPPPSSGEETKANVSSELDDPHRELRSRLSLLKSILSGECPTSLHLEFLFSNNHADRGILSAVKRCIETRNSVCHSAMVYANAMAHAGTTVDTFLRENLDWLSRAVNWAKFSATAGLGVIHRGHLHQSRQLMAPYLPRNGVSGSNYSEGGALYALGLIHANHGEGIRNFLLESLRSASNETTQHGACLGLGLASLGTFDEQIYESVKEVLYSDNAVAGEAAGLCLGLLMVGSGSKDGNGASPAAEEMLSYAHDTQHEKIIRGLAIGLSLTVYGREEEAETLIEQMIRDQDPILRYGGMYALGLSYRGTGSNSAIKRLLHFAVSDVDDDVRRSAVLNLGFVMFNVPEQLPRTVSLLSESYNPHVRYGAAMAIGICCSGTGMPDALNVLEPMMNDAVDFVRQGALIAMAMVLIQENTERKQVASFRAHLSKVTADKHEDTMCKMGAIMAVGILDAGGRNCSIQV